MSFGTAKPGTRRAQIRAGRPDTLRQWWDGRRADGTVASLWIALLFVAASMAVMSLRDQVIANKPGQYVAHDLVARTEFVYHDKDQFAEGQNRARADQPRVYREEANIWDYISGKLIDLPSRVAGLNEGELPPELQGVVEGAALTRLREAGASESKKASYQDSVLAYVEALRKLDLIILPDEQRPKEVDRSITIPRRGSVRGELTYSPKMQDELSGRIQRTSGDTFAAVLQPVVMRLTLKWLRPTHTLDESATAQAMSRAAESVPVDAGNIRFAANQVMVPHGEIRDRDWQILRAESAAYNAVNDRRGWFNFFGLLTLVVLLTGMMCAYIAQYQPRIIRNHARGLSIASLLLATLLVAQLAGISNQPFYVFALAPTLLVAMIMSIVYDRRFGVGIGALHALLVALALGESVGFVLMLLAGVATTCILLDEIRSRSKLIEVGGAAAVAMMIAAAAIGLLDRDPLQFTVRNCLHAGAAGLGVGFAVLGILPFIEKLFRITTAMTLLELADVSQTLLRRIAADAPGTWNHSLQVAAMAEEAAETIGGNSLLCRVGSYYHDCGKINKPEYFVENQHDGVNRHLNLSPSVSLLIIIGHVKDGIELAREYNLPTSIFPFIQQHHGTTRVEFFYDRAIRQAGPETGVSETQYRYPGPKPKSKEIGIVMLADCCESAARAMAEPTSGLLENLVDEMTRRRIEDGQLDECDLTMRDVERIKRSLIKSLLGIYHGRIAYPNSPGAQTTGHPSQQHDGGASVAM